MMRSQMKWQFVTTSLLLAATLVAVPSGPLVARSSASPAERPSFGAITAPVLPLDSSVELLELAAVTLAADLEAVPASLEPTSPPCPHQRLEVSWQAPDGYVLGAYLEPVGPRPDITTTDVNGVVVCAGSQAGFMGFEAHRESTSWRLYPVPAPEAPPQDPASDDDPPLGRAVSAIDAAEPNVDGLPLGSLGAIDAYATYDPQRTCDPSPERGAVLLAELLLDAVPGTTNLGIARPCHLGPTSEHKEGRAFDWGVRPQHAAAVDEVLARLLATDDDGNAHALARRMGIMYVIWDGAIWASYHPHVGWRPYRGPDRHTDHVHLSLSRDGGLGRTSFWRASDPAATLEAAHAQGGGLARGPSAGATSPRVPGAADAEVPPQPTVRDPAPSPSVSATAPTAPAPTAKPTPSTKPTPRTTSRPEPTPQEPDAAPDPSPGAVIDDPVGPAPVAPEEGARPPGALGPVDPADYFAIPPSVTSDRDLMGVQFATSGPDLWAWQPRLGTSPDRLARYTSGVWWSYPAPPSDLPTHQRTTDGSGVDDRAPGWAWTWDIAELPDGTILAATGKGLHELSDGGWQPHPDWQSVPGCDGRGCSEQSRHPTAVEVDPTSGTVWVAAGSGLYRWEGDAITNVAPGPEIWTDDARWIGDLAVTPGGTVWGTGYAAPYWLQSYVPGTHAWEDVDPWPGGKDDNVAVMAVAPDGDLWVVKNVIGEGLQDRPWGLARRDADTGRWNRYADWLPGGDPEGGTVPHTMVADRRGVTVTVKQYDPRTGVYDAGVAVNRFDGIGWETWQQDHRIEAVGLAGDGTTWAALRDQGLIALSTNRPTSD
jgi:hypothetical protein